MLRRQGVADSPAKASAWAPMHQGPFLQDLGIASRLEALIAHSSTPEQQDALIEGATRLVSGAVPSSPSLTEAPAESDSLVSSERPRRENESAHKARRVQTQGQGGVIAGEAAKRKPAAAQDMAGQEGMGYQYMALAVTPSKQGAPFPFCVQPPIAS